MKSFLPPFFHAGLAFGIAVSGVKGDENPKPLLQLPCLAALVEQARSGDGPLAFEEAFFDGPFRRISENEMTTEALIDRGYSKLHGFWNAEAERCFREAFQRDADSVDALLGLALTNAERPRRFATFLAKATSVAANRRDLSEPTRWWLEMLQIGDEGERHRRLEQRVATHPTESLPALWLARGEILDFQRGKEGAIDRAAWDRLLVSVESPAAATYRRLLWADQPPKDDLPNLPPVPKTSNADIWRIAGEFEKGRDRWEALLELFTKAVQADLNWLDSRLAMPDEAQNLGADSAALATLLSDLGREEAATTIARRFADLPYHPGAAGTTQPWRRIEDTCREANTRAIESIETRKKRRTEIRTAIDAGEFDAALAMAHEDRLSRPHAWDARANEIEALWRKGQRKEALFDFDRGFRRRLANADESWRNRPVFSEIAAAMKLEPVSAERETGRNELESLRWHAPKAPERILKRGDAVSRNLGGKQEKATLAIFFLGAGCPRCVEQLTAFLPYLDDFAEAGVEVIGISTDSADETAADFPIPLFADPNLEAFRDYEAFDEFLDRPLHATYLIDSDGNVRWRETGNTPFLRAEWLLGELEVLLSQSKKD
ncbi:MAG: peroxiredoxin family protein [Verrucomicrobiae bacterium]|nr:peroxiredoxin family protein [Verrucomicrobiae bacterium]